MQSGAAEPTETDRAEQDPFQDAENAPEDVIRDDALEQCQSCNVRHRVSDADDDERGECDRKADEHPDEGEGETEEHNAEPEVGSESAPCCEHEGGEASKEAAHPECRAQVADPRLAGVDELERHKHDQDVHGPARNA